MVLTVLLVLRFMICWAVGGKAIVEIYSQANITGSFVNVARVNGSQYDHNPANNRDEASILVKPATDLAIKKEVNESRPNFASDIKWTLIASNNGPNDATGVVVRDILPKSLIWVSDDGLGKYDHNSGVWNIGDLNKNGNARLTIVCTVNSTGTIENRASISGNEFDWIQSNNNAKKAINVNSACDLGIVKEVSSSVVNYTDVVKWTLTVSNYGPDSATGVKIYDLLAVRLSLRFILRQTSLAVSSMLPVLTAANMTITRPTTGMRHPFLSNLQPIW